MSTAPPVPPAPVPEQGPGLAPSAKERDEVMIVSHSNIFYWWPVWAVGFLMAGLTAIDGHRMAVVPAGSQSYYGLDITLPKGEQVKRDAIVLPEKTHLEANDPSKGVDSGPEEPHLMIARSRSYGVLFLTVLILVIVITNVPLRGMWSVVVIITVILLAIIFALAEWWETILRHAQLSRHPHQLWRLLFLSVGVAHHLAGDYPGL